MKTYALTKIRGLIYELPILNRQTGSATLILETANPFDSKVPDLHRLTLPVKLFSYVERLEKGDAILARGYPTLMESGSPYASELQVFFIRGFKANQGYFEHDYEEREDQDNEPQVRNARTYRRVGL